MPMDEPMFVIYERPTDYPTRYVVRKWHTLNGLPHPSDYFTLHDTLEEARATVPPFMVRFPRDPKDMPCIVESYF